MQAVWHGLFPLSGPTYKNTGNGSNCTCGYHAGHSIKAAV